ncbi:hypothetical protein N7481_002425 [Penicillium waksmanii]|uniref:uncharacterized protein n=1 Tax=Penicillium waksmanii TaxID=69791 RepID=UPI0025476BB7|nr:uncharacterized protein N7481_002425 [Penicillium waksmanii]KAJ5995448.1 hypothetical protein N7481_002425 [Penicillium waksmanii]
MTLHLSFPLLLACAFPIILAAPSSSAYLQTDTPTQFPTRNTNAEPLLLVPEAEGDTGDNSETGRLLSRNDVSQEPVIYGKDDSERQIAMCEAGFVRSCYAAVEAGNSDTSPPFTTDTLDTDSPFTFPSTGFLVATFAAFCILAMIRKSLGRRTAPQQEGKK